MAIYHMAITSANISGKPQLTITSVTTLIKVDLTSVNIITVDLPSVNNNKNLAKIIGKIQKYYKV